MRAWSSSELVLGRITTINTPTSTCIFQPSITIGKDSRDSPLTGKECLQSSLTIPMTTLRPFYIENGDSRKRKAFQHLVTVSLAIYAFTLPCAESLLSKQSHTKHPRTSRPNDFVSTAFSKTLLHEKTVRPLEFESQSQDKKCQHTASHTPFQNSFRSLAITLVASFFLWLWCCFQPTYTVANAAVEFDTTRATVTTTTPPYGKRYWSIMNNEIDEAMQSSPATLAEEREWANKALVDYVVSTINTQYYDNSGGAYFNPRDFAKDWHIFYGHLKNGDMHKKNPLTTRDGAVATLKHMVKSLNDPYSQYLTREELLQELDSHQQFGFLGVGAIIEAPPNPSLVEKESARFKTKPITAAMMMNGIAENHSDGHNGNTITKTATMLSVARASQLPVVTAIVPDSPAERAGLVVGDRLVAVPSTKEDFLAKTLMGRSRSEAVSRLLEEKYNARPSVKYFGQVELVVAKPFYAVPMTEDARDNMPFVSSSAAREMVVGYRPVRVRLTVPSDPWSPSNLATGPIDGDIIKRHKIAGGDQFVHYELLSSSSGLSILDRMSSSKARFIVSDEVYSSSMLETKLARLYAETQDNKVGYIRLTRFSRASTEGYFRAIQALEKAGAQSYIIDLRNNYGGVIQEAMVRCL